MREFSLDAARPSASACDARAMTEPLVIDITELRRALQRGLDITEALLGTRVELDVDYYWHLPVRDSFDMTKEPTELTAGQVSDDLDEAVHDRSERVPEEAWHDLAHLVGVLRALEFAARA